MRALIISLIAIALCISCSKEGTKKELSGSNAILLSTFSIWAKYGNFQEFLYADYPNPLGLRSSDICYSLKDTCEIKIDIFDSLSQKIDSVDFGVKQAGSYLVKWNPSKKVYGLYNVKINTCDSIITKTIELSK